MQSSNWSLGGQHSPWHPPSPWNERRAHFFSWASRVVLAGTCGYSLMRLGQRQALFLDWWSQKTPRCWVINMEPVLLEQSLRPQLGAGDFLRGHPRRQEDETGEEKESKRECIKNRKEKMRVCYCEKRSSILLRCMRSVENVPLKDGGQSTHHWSLMPPSLWVFPGVWTLLPSWLP